MDSLVLLLSEICFCWHEGENESRQDMAKNLSQRLQTSSLHGAARVNSLLKTTEPERLTSGPEAYKQCCYLTPSTCLPLSIFLHIAREKLACQSCEWMTFKKTAKDSCEITEINCKHSAL